MKTSTKIWIGIGIVIVILLIIFFSNHSIVNKQVLLDYENLKNAKTETTIDTLIVRDTLKFDVDTPYPVPVTETVEVPVPVLDSIALQKALQEYFAINIVKDERTFDDKAKLTIIDSLSQNKIFARQIALDIYRADTIIKEVNNHITRETAFTPRNHVDFRYALSTESFKEYELSYMRQFGSNKLQYKLGMGVGYLQYPNGLMHNNKSGDMIISIKAGVAF